MSQTNDCVCTEPSVAVPVTGLTLNLSQEALAGIAGGGNSIDYSFNEQWTGKYWIDGKKIYQKTVNYGAVPNTVVKHVAHNIPNVQSFVSIYGIAASGTAFIDLPYGGVNTYAVAIGGDAVNLHISTMRSWAGYTAFLTVQYTCTDR